MKVAEALIKRAELTEKIENINNRILINLQIQDGDSPNEDPQILIRENMNNIEELSKLIATINRTNQNTVFEGELTVADAIIEKENLIKKANMCANAVMAASIKESGNKNTEVKYISVIDIKEYQKKKDAFAKEWRRIDTKLDKLNWETELLEF